MKHKKSVKFYIIRRRRVFCIKYVNLRFFRHIFNRIINSEKRLPTEKLMHLGEKSTNFQKFIKNTFYDPIIIKFIPNERGHLN
jgi:hypothetical protein